MSVKNLLRRGPLARRRTAPPATTDHTFEVAVSGDDGYAYKTTSSNWPPDTTTGYDGTYLELYAAKEATGVGGTYSIINAVMRWNTASLAGLTITAATLEVRNGDNPGFNTDSKTASAGWFTFTGTTSDYLATAETTAFSGYNYMADNTVGGVRTVTLANAAANVSTSGYTGLRFHLSDGSTPTGRNYWAIASYDHSTLIAPRLIVTTLA